MAAAPRTFLIVGAGLAGAKAAQTLREQGFDGRLLLVGAEPERPYERPALSKGYLSGSASRDSLYVHDQEWYGNHGVELRTDVTVTDLDAAAHQVVLDDGDHVHYDKLLLATGSSARRLPLPGLDLDGVRYLRQLPDAERLAEDLSGGGRRVVIVGGGWIGLEVAAAARGHGNQVVVVERQGTVLPAALGPELGEVFARLHRDHDVDLRLGTGVHAFEGVGGRITSVTTGAGEDLTTDLVVIGVGAQPNTELAARAGLAVDNGVVVDAALRSSHPDVFAAGDVANAYHPLLGRQLRVEHWANALHSGPAAARSMLGQPVTYDQIPYFYTDQYDLGMEYSGDLGPDGYDQIVYRGEPAGREFIAFWLRAGRVVAGMNVNVWDVAGPIQALIRSGTVVDPGRLADPEAPLEQLTATTR
ncbi:MAG: FAD-dependent oxidoreductase [Actinobacteria bacterium]|nr:FAD-dependent oxidoreductase [Actinomycetota bacterium]